MSEASLSIGGQRVGVCLKTRVSKNALQHSHTVECGKHLMARLRSRHFTVVATFGPRWVELGHSKVVVSWLLQFHALFRSAPPQRDRERNM